MLLVVAEDVLEGPVAHQVDVLGGGNADDKVFLLLAGEFPELAEEVFISFWVVVSFFPHRDNMNSSP